MIVEVIGSLASIVMLVLAFAIYPSSATCPPGTYLGEGIRRSGEFACVAVPPRGCGEPTGPYVECPEPKRSRSRIHCTGGQRPIVVDYRTVGCQR